MYDKMKRLAQLKSPQETCTTASYTDCLGKAETRQNNVIEKENLIASSGWRAFLMM
jgi:hypothetical protein